MKLQPFFSLKPILMTTIEQMLQRQETNKNATIGSEISCVTCSKKIVKKSYQTQYCRNKGKGNCKDKFHNISKGKVRYYNESDYIDSEEKIEVDYNSIHCENGWDAHKIYK